MIQKDTPFFWDVSCDGCAAGEELIATDEAETFRDVVKEIRGRGWTVQRGATSGWEHLCPDCAGGILL